jgi:uncharacterized phage protein (TIGR01671 family)
MREILFKGKRTDNKQWVEGYYVLIATTRHYIFTGKLDILGGGVAFERYEVIPETISEFTGLCDKNGKKIFEGDILSHYINWLGRRVNGVCEYDDKEQAAWMCRFVDESGNEATGFLAGWVDNNGCEIIGNIHDNPELLKGGAE